MWRCTGPPGGDRPLRLPSARGIVHEVAGASLTGEGRGGQDPRTFENRGGRLPINLDISVTFDLETFKNFAFSNIFKIKWPKPEGS